MIHTFAATLPPGYLAIQPLGLGKGVSEISDSILEAWGCNFIDCRPGKPVERATITFHSNSTNSIKLLAQLTEYINCFVQFFLHATHINFLAECWTGHSMDRQSTATVLRYV